MSGNNNMTLLVDKKFFYIMRATSIIIKIERKENPVTAYLAYMEMYYLLDYDYPQHYEVALTALHFIIYEDKRIPVDILGHFNKIVEQYNKFKAG